MTFGIKKLDRLIIKSFLGPFVITFFIVLFIFVMQFFWLYMDDLIGKGLATSLILELMLYLSATLVPMALPLGILLAAIMTFGNLGESFELVAIKSSGISLFRFMRPLIIFITAVSIGAFYFSNYVIPYANLKTFSLLYDMRNKKPTMSIKPGIFNREIGNFAIRVGSKSKDGASIKDIMIYDHTKGYGNDNLVLAERGKMYLSTDKRFLIFELNNGWRYDMKRTDTGYEQQRMYFKKWNKVLDVSGFGFSRTKEELFQSSQEMMNISMLSQNIDSIQKSIKKEKEFLTKSTGQYLSLQNDAKISDELREKIKKYETVSQKRKYKKSLLELFPDSLKSTVVDYTVNNAQSARRYASIAMTNQEVNDGKLNQFKVEWHRKFTLSFACLLLFLIGAPLGAIIRKGGLGMPMVISVVFFVVYFIISSTGEKLAKQGKMPAANGMWLATVVLLPIAIIIMVQARNDSAIFKMEAYKQVWGKILRFFKRKKSTVA